MIFVITNKGNVAYIRPRIPPRWDPLIGIALNWSIIPYFHTRMFGYHHLSFVVTEYSGTYISGCTTVKLRLQGSIICFFCSTSRPSVIVSIVEQWTFLDYVFRAYDKAALQCNGKEAVTNFDPSIYGDELIPGADSGGTISRNPDIHYAQNKLWFD